MFQNLQGAQNTSYTLPTYLHDVHTFESAQLPFGRAVGLTPAVSAFLIDRSCFLLILLSLDVLLIYEAKDKPFGNRVQVGVWWHTDADGAPPCA